MLVCFIHIPFNFSFVLLLLLLLLLVWLKGVYVRAWDKDASVNAPFLKLRKASLAWTVNRLFRTQTVQLSDRHDSLVATSNIFFFSYFS